MHPSASMVYHQIEEAIPLSPAEKITQATRNQLNAFRSSTPLPCLWVTAHLPNPIPWLKSPALQKILADSGHQEKPGSLSLEMLRTNRGGQRTADNIANTYREFLQKQLIRLNNKLLKYKTTGLCFHFRGTLERNAADPGGRQLHYHFALWAPKGLFAADASLMPTTRQTLIDLWHQRVNNQVTKRHKPIHIEVIKTQQDADHIASYEAKANLMTQAYGIFDDWSLAGCPPVPA